MRNIIAVVLALTLGGCEAIRSFIPGGITIADVTKFTKEVCGWAEPAENLAKIIKAGPVTMTAISLANDICTAVTLKSSARGAVVAVYGVPLKGSRVR